MVDNEYDFPVFNTSNYGLARQNERGIFVFVRTPMRSKFKVGDQVPDMWLVSPANELARQQTQNDLDQKMPGMDWSH